jgi:hypothetical protein
VGNPFGDVVGGLASAGNALASKAKSVAKAATSEVATDARLFAGGANQVLGMPTFNTLKGATQGHPADIAKVGAAAALMIPAARGLRGLRGGVEAERSAAEAFDLAKVTQFPDTEANLARRVKGRVMGAISMQSGSDLASKIAATRDEIVKIGGTPPTGPFAAATEGKLAAVKTEIGAIDKGAADVAQMSLAQRAKAGAVKMITGGEEGWIRASATKTTSGKDVSVLRFGAGKFPGEANIGEGITTSLQRKAGFYEAQLSGGAAPGTVKVNWLGKHGDVSFKNVQPEVKAIGLGLKARGITAVEHEPLSQSRSRLFAGMLKGSGFKNVDKGPPDIERRLPNQGEIGRSLASMGFGR